MKLPRWFLGTWESVVLKNSFITMAVVESDFELFSLLVLSNMLQVEILGDYFGLLNDTSSNELD